MRNLIDGLAPGCKLVLFPSSARTTRTARPTSRTPCSTSQTRMRAMWLASIPIISNGRLRSIRTARMRRGARAGEARRRARGEMAALGDGHRSRVLEMRSRFMSFLPGTTFPDRPCRPRARGARARGARLRQPAAAAPRARGRGARGDRALRVDGRGPDSTAARTALMSTAFRSSFGFSSDTRPVTATSPP